ncbi:MAG: lytic transglycosylase domain-containing protein [Bacteroidetes bacterium]|nr:lytic transglycosylase domain-containing protein [Bacteroidota bacterium]MBS1758444.1 lytic transglycosylase domain-containing protein [Bacteroidota bacterium]
MKNKIVIPIFLLMLLSATVHAQENGALPDTSINTEVAEDSMINQIVTTRKSLEKDKVQYFSQLTRYGFKNLFSKFSYNPLLPYSSQVNPQAESYMQGYLNLHSKSLLKMKTWGLPYFNLIDNIFAQYGLPRELKYLAVIESNLNTGATSWVGAGGPWQFMPYTARDYGLVVTPGYDERRDYYKSTNAAARYLLTLYRQLHDWLLVIAAYNGGPGRVFSAIKKSGSKNFWALQYYLPEESRNHVKKFIATHYIMEGTNGTPASAEFSAGIQGANAVSNPYDNKPDLSSTELANAETQTISGKFNSVIIAKNLAMNIALFNRYNPQFDNLINTNGQFQLILPADKMQLFLATKYQILNECVQFMLSDNSIPDTKTVYPTRYKGKKKNSR